MAEWTPPGLTTQPAEEWTPPGLTDVAPPVPSLSDIQKSNTIHTDALDISKTNGVSFGDALDYRKAGGDPKRIQPTATGTPLSEIRNRKIAEVLAKATGVEIVTEGQDKTTDFNQPVSKDRAVIPDTIIGTPSVAYAWAKLPTLRPFIESQKNVSDFAPDKLMPEAQRLLNDLTFAQRNATTGGKVTPDKVWLLSKDGSAQATADPTAINRSVAEIRKDMDAVAQSRNLADRLAGASAVALAQYKDAQDRSPGASFGAALRDAIKGSEAEAWSLPAITEGQKIGQAAGGVVGGVGKFLYELAATKGAMRAMGGGGGFSMLGKGFETLPSRIKTSAYIANSARAVAAFEATDTKTPGMGAITGAAFEVGGMAGLLPGPGWAKKLYSMLGAGAAGAGTGYAQGADAHTTAILAVLPAMMHGMGAATDTLLKFVKIAKPELPPEEQKALVEKMDAEIPAIDKLPLPPTAVDRAMKAVEAPGKASDMLMDDAVDILRKSLPDGGAAHTSDELKMMLLDHVTDPVVQAREVKIDALVAEKGITREQATAFLDAQEPPAISKVETAQPQVEATDLKGVIEKLSSQLDTLSPVWQANQANITEAYRKARAERTSVADAIEKEGLAAGKSRQEIDAEVASTLSGKLADRPTTGQEALPQLTEAEWELAYQAAEAKYPEANVFFTRKNTKEAITNVLRNGETPTPGQVELIENLLGKKVGDALRKLIPAEHRLLEGLLKGIGDVADLTKALPASDIGSMALRQMLPAVGRDFFRLANLLILRKPGFKAIPNILKGMVGFFSEGRAKRMIEDYKASKWYEPMKQEGYITDAPTRSVEALRDESYSSTFAEKIPVIGWWVRAANRSALIMTNGTRIALMEAAAKFHETLGVEMSPRKIGHIMGQIGNLTGRSYIINTPTIQKFVTFANHIVWTVRFNKAKLINLSTAFGMISRDPYVAMEGLKTLTGTAGLVASLGAAAKLFGYDFNYNILATGFGSVQKGDQRYDITGGLGSFLRDLARISTGYTQDAAGHYKPISRQDALAGAAWGKFTPIAGIGKAVWKQTTFANHKIEGFNPADQNSWSRLLMQSLTPMQVFDVANTFMGNIKTMGLPQATLESVPSLVASNIGISTQNYPKSAIIQETIFKDEIAQKAHKMDWENLSPIQQNALLKAPANKTRLDALEGQKSIEAEGRDSSNARARGEKEAKEAGQAVYEKLPANLQAAIQNNEYSVEIKIDRKLVINKNDWYLNEARFSKYQELVYPEIVARLRYKVDQAGWMNLPASKRKEQVEKAINLAKAVADKKLVTMANRGEQ